MSVLGYCIIPFIALLVNTLLINSRESLARERGWVGPVLVGLVGIGLSYALSFAVGGDDLAALSPIIVPAIIAGVIGEVMAPKYWTGSFVLATSASVASLAVCALLAMTGQQPDGTFATVNPSDLLVLGVIPMFAAALLSGIFRAYRNRSYTTAD